MPRKSVVLMVALALPVAALAQTRPGRTATDSVARSDSARTRRLDPMVVSAERTEQPISTVAASVTRLSRAELDALPVHTVAQALEFVPGIAVLQADALGQSPQVIARGFYGGGETDYVLLLLDGVPLNGLTSGGVNWDLVPLAVVDAIEVVRGGASSMYGDAALGGVVNLITRRGSGRVRTLALSRGAFDVTRGDGSLTERLGGHDLSLSVGAYRTGGYRIHESRQAVTMRVATSLIHRRLDVSAIVHERGADDPGPLDDSALVVSPRGASSFYRFDHTQESSARVVIDGSATMQRATVARGYLAGEFDRADVVRTLPLTATFADTKRRVVPTKRLLGSWQVETSGLTASDRVMVGTDASTGSLTSTYWELLNGGARTYAQSGVPLEKRDADGHGRRSSVGAFAKWEIEPVDRLRLTAGTRYDYLADAFDTERAGGQLTGTHTAWSPRLAATVRAIDSDRQDFGVYVALGRSFKAPTMDQLFDQRSIPVPFPPFSITTSNALLVPQTGSGLEAGVQHRLDLFSGSVVSRWSATAYQMSMRDELDFDLKAFHFVNVAESRHRGVEVSASAIGPHALGATATYSQQDAVATNGSNAGHFLRGIPRRTATVRLMREPARGVQASVTAVRVQDTPFDDANTSYLPAYTRVDARVAYPVGPTRIVLEVRNALDATYSSTGYPDPGGSATRFYYPAASRALAIGADARW